MANDETTANNYDKSFFGHPGGLSTLFFTELWERFSYYGMRALLVLYMVAAVQDGGLGFTTPDATAIYGLYTASVYFLPLIGGWLADRFIGAKRATLIGGIIIAAGHFALAVPTLSFFYIGLVLVAVGTGFLKSNISAMVGDLYDEDDERRDGGFTIFYMGINLGAFAAPLVCGALAAYNWHYGFAAAGVGMVAGLIQYILGKRKLEGVGEPPVKQEAEASSLSTAYLIQLGAVVVLSIVALIISYYYFYPLAVELANDPANQAKRIADELPPLNPMIEAIGNVLKIVLIPVLVVAGLIAVVLTGMQDKLSLNDWKRLGIIIILFLFAALFWAGFEQAGSSFNLFAENLTERTVGTFEIPAAWFQSINAIMIVILAPLFSIMWIKWGKKQPNDIFKFALGLFFLALGFVVMAYASGLTGASKVSPMWLVLVYFLHTVGELFLSPVGLSSMTKLAPGKMVGLMLGVWFLAASLGSFAAGQIAGEFDPEKAEPVSLILPSGMLEPLGISSAQPPLVGLFGNLAIVIFIGTILAVILSFLVGGFLKSRQPTAEVPIEPA